MTSSSSRAFASPTGAIVCLLAAEVVSILLPVSLPLWLLGLVMMVRTTVWSERDRWLGLLALGSGFPASLVFLASLTLATSSCSTVTRSGEVESDTCGGLDVAGVAVLVVVVAYLALQALTVWRLARAARAR